MALTRFLPRLSYKNILIFATAVSMFLAVADRLALSVTCGDTLLKRPGRCKIPLGTPGLSLISVYMAVSARVLIVSLNLSFVTIFWVLPNIFEEIAPRWLETDCKEMNLRIHRFAGIWLNGVGAVLHTALFFLPAITQEVPFKFYYDGFNWSEFWDPVVRVFGELVDEDMINATVDEFWRLFGMILVFCIMLPLSRSDWMLGRSYSLAMAIHAIAGFGFMIDMMRKKTHPLCWYFNLPCIGLYIVDRLYATFLYRVHVSRIYKLKRCGNNSLIAYIHVPYLTLEEQGCGDLFFLLHKLSFSCKPVFQRAHPFTVFQNCDRTTRNLWNVGMTIKVNPAEKNSWTLWLMCRDNEITFDEEQPSIAITYQKATHGSALENPENGEVNPAFEGGDRGHEHGTLGKPMVNNYLQERTGVQGACEKSESGSLGVVRSWGPYRSTFYQVKNWIGQEELLLVAGGTGFAFIISVIGTIHKNLEWMEPSADSPDLPVRVFYTARETGLVKEYCALAATMPGYEKLSYTTYYTGPEEFKDELSGMGALFNVKHHRGDLDEFFQQSKNSQRPVKGYACASPAFLEIVEKIVGNYGIHCNMEGI